MTAGPVRLVAAQSLLAGARERTVVLLAALFLVLIAISAYLGWSATGTVHAVYLRAAAFMAERGQSIPPDPVLDNSPLALLRNMATYVSLIGSLAAIIIGHQLIAVDRKAGVAALIGTRPLSRAQYGLGKLAALVLSVAGLIAFAGAVNALAFLLLPGLHLGAAGIGRLAGFYAVSALYMAIFGCLGLAFGARARSEAAGLLAPVTVWLTLTFVLPQLTSNINPVAALNPVSALAAPPPSAFFAVMGWALGPISLAEAYRAIAARWLDVLPAAYLDRAAVPPLVSLLVAALALAVLAVRSIAGMETNTADLDA